MAAVDSIAIPPRVKDLTGQVFGRLTVVCYAGMAKSRHSRWTCQCSCGAICAPLGTSLIEGRTLSCGCLNRENATQMMIDHGMSNYPEHAIWHKMIERCYSPSSISYRNYGGRGITVCAAWKLSFAKFFSDMGPRPSENHSIDRIDNDGNYEPSNCRWATPEEQSLNTRRNVRLTCNGRTMCLREWARELGITDGAIRWRIEQGWPVERAVTVPRRHRHLPDIITSIKTLS